MTYGFKNLYGIVNLYQGNAKKTQWHPYAEMFYNWFVGCHIGHHLDFAVALICYWFLFPITFPEAHEFRWSWIWKVIAFNLVAEFTLYGFWHWVTYGGFISQGPLKQKKLNKENQYESGSGHLTREITYTTLGFLQSSIFQIVIMHLWATGKVSYYANFWDYPVWSIFHLLLINYWREFHFYWVHRGMHPWWNRKFGLKDGDVGAFLYRHFHSLHHKSYNPGPFSGLSMHPVEHFVYYTCTLLCLVFTLHPIHFLFVKFHADIAPIGGHDGFGDPAGGADYHYLHHAKFECNYGVPLINFDALFGTFLDYEDYKKTINNNYDGSNSPSPSNKNKNRKSK